MKRCRLKNFTTQSFRKRHSWENIYSPFFSLLLLFYFAVKVFVNMHRWWLIQLLILGGNKLILEMLICREENVTMETKTKSQSQDCSFCCTNILSVVCLGCSVKFWCWCTVQAEGRAQSSDGWIWQDSGRSKRKYDLTKTIQVIH